MQIIDVELNPVHKNAFEFCNLVYDSANPHCVVNIIYDGVKVIETMVGGLGKRT